MTPPVDIVERIRGLRYVHVPVASELMAEAAAEIERLRNGAVTGCESDRNFDAWKKSPPSLTDEERAAILTAADLLIGSKPGATLRSLLARLSK